MQYEYIENPKFEAIQYDGSNLEQIKTDLKVDIRTSPMGTEALFFEGQIIAQINPGDWIVLEIYKDLELQPILFSAVLFNETFKTI